MIYLVSTKIKTGKLVSRFDSLKVISWYTICKIIICIIHIPFVDIVNFSFVEWFKSVHFRYD